MVIAQTCPQDVFEPNDACLQAPIIPLGTTIGLTNGDQEYDNYRLMVPAGQLVEVRLRVLNPSNGVGGFFSLLEADTVDCLHQTAFGEGTSAYFQTNQQNIQLGWTSPQSEPQEFLINLFTFGDPNHCIEYELDVSLTPNLCTYLPTDGFSMNHSCQAAAPAVEGTYTGLRASVSEKDYYVVDVAANSVGTVEIFDIDTQGQVYLWAWNAANACSGGDPVRVRAIYAESGGFYLPNTTSSSQSFVVMVQPRPEAISQRAFCLDYSMRISFEENPCGGMQGDRFEPNDTAGTATPIASTELDLTSTAIDSDYYAIDVPPRGTLTVTRSGSLFPSHFKLSGENGNSHLASNQFIGSGPNDPRHRITWQNASNTTRSTVLLVGGNRSFPTAFCGTYDLEVEITYGGAFCTPSVNSTGHSAHLKATGSIIVGQGAMTLTTGPTPPGQYGITFFGQGTQAPAPLGGGSLCISGQLHRLPIASPAGDGLQTTIDWNSPGVAAVIQPGTTWRFQTWYRDHGGLSNVSEGRGVTFQ